MIEKKDRLIIAFDSTHDAIAFEAACLKSAAEGRLIPLPREISAGCGLAWSASPDSEPRLREILRSEGIRAAQVRRCLV